MKQHILRLLIVLILAVGIGFVIFYLVKDNSVFNVSSFAKEEFNKNSNSYSLVEELRDEAVIITNNKTIYDSLYESFNYYAKFLVNNVSKDERDSIKTSFQTFNEKYAELNFSLNSLKNYLQEQNRNETELNGRKEQVGEDFKNLNLSLYSIALKLENLVKVKVFNNTYLDATFALTSSKNLLLKTYLDINNGSKYSFVKSVADKVTALKEHNYFASEDSIKFAIKYNSIHNDVSTLFHDYIDNDVTNSDLNDLLIKLNKEAYYE